MTSTLLRRVAQSIQPTRSLLRPPRNLPYRGIYRTDGETVRKNDVLVCQHTFNYHPGLNVIYENDRGEKLLKANCDGVVRITTEICNPNLSLQEMEIYKYKESVELRKLTFNVIPSDMSQTFNLVSEV